jgi:hypothetical protein
MAGYAFGSNAPYALEARRRGWSVVTLEGTHLNPMLELAETMLALVSMSRQSTALRGSGLLALTRKIFRRPLRVIASEAKQSRVTRAAWIASSQELLAMT